MTEESAQLEFIHFSIRDKTDPSRYGQGPLSFIIQLNGGRGCSYERILDTPVWFLPQAVGVFSGDRGNPNAVRPSHKELHEETPLYTQPTSVEMRTIEPHHII